MLKGKNLILESITKDDLEYVYQIILDDDIGGAYTTTHYESTLSNIGTMLFETEKGTQSKVFVAKIKDEIIGFITLNDIHSIRRSAAIGAIGIKREYQKKIKDSFLETSYSIEIGGLLIVYAFEILNLHKLIAHTFSNNDNVNKLYENGGWTKEGVIRDFIPRNGKWLDRNDWGLLREEYDNCENYKRLKEYINWK